MKTTRSTAKPVHKPVFANGDDIQIPVFTLLKPDGTLYAGAGQPSLERDTARRLYCAMLYTRVLDERMMVAQRQGRLSFYMQCTGEEAAVVGATAALDDADMIMAQYREQGALAYRGFTTEAFMDQLFGNQGDPAHGRQMPIHYGSRELYYLTISSPLATQIPQATGYAYGQKLAGQGHCTLAIFGEGAASEGDFHAALNMASVHKVPVIFLCRNNGYAISTPVTEQFAGDGVAARAFGYRMQSIRVDGNDALAVYEATREARRLAVEENEPVLIEAMTYRLAAHSSSDDPSGYRSKKEEEAWRKKDPLRRLQRWLLDRGWWEEDEERELVESLRREVLDTMKRAEKRRPPALETLVTDVYAEVPPALREQFETLVAHVRRHPEAYPRSAPWLDTDQADEALRGDASTNGGEARP
ncbi:thiamine pyrophosphate-dependent dehydrogenase E1 component subunit alpha [Salinicola sp. JS01]|uniref:thiamine pyrophosphate-dependent dehydrogenase E1 component subunit alpha n=1 Tax=Salinicola sp. JS01 TaxID=3050071 RepID=UPI00255BD61D|nr:thiamine pyrophosphate-dependent dehydrogenase E1 component subunit alpha [Salinicola sp. JS01]WIX32753.1 thiamine pyrophosphate-dependent dehydrogenase E1 component subunit alpha [Salinicola sp. JS01]